MVLNVISAYDSQVGLDESAKRQFWKDLDGLIRAVPSSEKLFIGDLNGHVDTTSAGFETVYGGFGYGSRNQEGEEVLDFAVAFDLMIANIFFKKRISSSDVAEPPKIAHLRRCSSSTKTLSTSKSRPQRTVSVGHTPRENPKDPHLPQGSNNENELQYLSIS